MSCRDCRPRQWLGTLSPHVTVVIHSASMHARQVLEVDEKGRRPAQRPTLFYLPHCEADITDNLVAANAAPVQRRHTAILGNSFAMYAERWALTGSAQAQHRRAKPVALLRAVEEGAVLELPVPERGFPVAGAFNDMGLHLFPPRPGEGQSMCKDTM